MNNTPHQHSRHVTIALILLWLLVLGMFARTVAFPFVDWDDSTYILQNRLVVDPGSVALPDLMFTPNMGYSVPVLMLTQAALSALSDTASWLFHLFNVLVHGCAVTLTFLIARRLTSGATLIAALAAALFAVHPLVAEPVAWATGLKDLLSTTLALAATWNFAAWCTDPKTEPDLPLRPLMFAILFGVAAMLTKPQTILLGLGWAGLYWATPKARRRTAFTYASITLGLGLTMASINIFARRILEFDDVETAAGSPFLALGIQLQHLFLPTNLHPAYLMERNTIDATWILGLVALPAIAAAFWAGRRNTAVLLGLGIAVIAYLPVSNIIPFNRFIADSYLYLPMAGIAIALAGVGAASLQPRSKPYTAATIAAALLIAVLSWQCWQQTDRWSNHEKLWTPVTQAWPDASWPWLTLAQGYTFEGRFSDALLAYREAFARNAPTEHLSNVAIALMQHGQPNASECVMNAYLHKGNNRERALHNLALLLINHPALTPRFPASAHEALKWASSQHAKGALRWKPEWIQSLPKRTSTLPSLSADAPTWTPGACPALNKQPAPNPAIDNTPRQ